ncbi:hypothetical protein EYF80_022400 [Liparis tanakae]|uniref:Uncharacterized protein n=1 Tax=Liparis tanakae TaxID=230148 RepID=A0A4Z2HQK3_9TELE|nr:hypothetical protein EYF80_022400 [Liparis tanakae]
MQKKWNDVRNIRVMKLSMEVFDAPEYRAIISFTMMSSTSISGEKVTNDTSTMAIMLMQVSKPKPYEVPGTFPYPFLGSPAANHRMALGGSGQCVPQRHVMARLVGCVEFEIHVQASTEILAGL